MAMKMKKITGTVGNVRGKSIAIVLKPFCFVVLDISLIRIDFYGFLFDKY